ncbi:MAG: hypothetical protein QXG03_06180 [Halalkalicoccus sp.]
MGLLSLPRGALSGTLAALVMNVPIALQREGGLPAFVAAGAASGRDPETVSLRDAAIAHHVAGALAGVLYAILAGALGRIVGERTARVLAVSGVVVFIDAFFSKLVFPRFGGEAAADPERAARTQSAWQRSSFVFGLALYFLAPGGDESGDDR